MILKKCPFCKRKLKLNEIEKVYDCDNCNYSFWIQDGRIAARDWREERIWFPYDL